MITPNLLVAGSQKSPVMVVIMVVLSVQSSILAQGTVGNIQVTFDGPPIYSPGFAVGASNYFEAGVQFRALPTQFGPGSFVRVMTNPATGRPDNGTAYIQKTLNDPAISFSLTNGNVFSLQAVDLAEYSTVLSNAVTVQFVCYWPDGSSVTITRTTDGIIDGTGPVSDFQTFGFQGLDGLSRVEIGGSAWSLDNLVISTLFTPEPSCLSVFALGLIAFTLKRNRRKGKSIV